MTVLNALSRFVLCPLLVALGDAIFPVSVIYANQGQWVITGAILAALGIAMDMTLLDRLGHVGAYAADTLAATLVIWFSQRFLPGAAITFGGALGTGLLLGLSEVAMHRWVQASRRRGVRAGRP